MTASIEARFCWRANPTQVQLRHSVIQACLVGFRPRQWKPEFALISQEICTISRGYCARLDSAMLADRSEGLNIID
jgi:hypothetical protein